MKNITSFILAAYGEMGQIRYFYFSVILMYTLPLCGNIIKKVYCDNYSLVRLACVDTTTYNIYGMFSLVFSVIIPLVPILYSYAQILRICLKASKESQFKALNTCTPHLVFSVGCFFESIQSRFDMRHVLHEALASVYFLIIPPFLNPIMYGMRIAKVRTTFKNTLFSRKLSSKVLSHCY
ncbi:O52K1 protein, partial [Amia calva]|nr:O52K1 protein [Amia calva]